MMTCCRAASILRSLSSGCENASWTPDCSAGSKLRDRIVASSSARCPTTRSRCRRPTAAAGVTPVDEKRSLTSTPRSPSRKFEGGVDVVRPPERRREDRREGAAALADTRAASTSVPRRTIARSGLCSTARCTASASVSCSVSGFPVCADAVVAVRIVTIAVAGCIERDICDSWTSSFVTELSNFHFELHSF